MMTKYSRILSMRLQAMVGREAANCNSGWEQGLALLLRRSNVAAFRRSTGPGLIPRILVFVVLSALSLARASSAGQPESGLSQQQEQQSPTCPTHQSRQSVACPMHAHHRSEQGNPVDQEKQQSAAPAQAHMQPPGRHDHDAMNQRGNTGMGFDQEKTTHHFRLFPDGGAIEVESNDAADSASRDQIRAHLAHIAVLFTAGDFSIPMFVHDQIPPGVETMKQLRQAIKYEYEETEQGGRISISTSDPKALEAIHAFLRFQIREHKTSDSLEVGKH